MQTNEMLLTFTVLYHVVIGMVPYVMAQPLQDTNFQAIPRGNLVEMSIAMAPEDPELLERILHAVSDPLSSRYGDHLTRDEAKALLRPQNDSSSSIKRWLSNSGIPSENIVERGQSVHVQATHDEIDHLLTRHHGGLPKRSRKPQYLDPELLPLQVRSHISLLHLSPVRRNGHPKTRLSSRSHRIGPSRAGRATPRPVHVDLDDCKEEIVPDCLRWLYKLPGSPTDSSEDIVLGVAGFNEQAARYEQLEKFLDDFDPDSVGGNFTVALVNGGDNPQGEVASGEANLDIQYAVSLAYNLPVQYYAVGGENHDFIPDLDLHDADEAYIEPWLEFADYLLDLDDDDLPQVMSISYGENEQLLHKSYAKRVCNKFGQLGTRGMSIIVSGGDEGPGISCMSNDGKNTTKFLPSWPASCPYVTAVGAVGSNRPEAALNFSGGGFSEYFSRPSWQDGAVEAYLDEYGDEWDGYYNPKGRAFPDVASQGANFQIYNHDAIQSADGSSASAPTFAAIIALLNNQRLNDGYSTLGFLNPWIWTIGNSGFTDITEGRSEGCKGTSLWGLPSPVIEGAGWSAAKGWDPVTGWGTPLYDKLKKSACGRKKHVESVYS